ncbi:MAG: porphobilinogen synthase [Bradymonadaceae bacterium]|nr:porphobilinogen synthase [Lujinxingiaceae bacterium]
MTRRPRRLRHSALLRDMVRETRVTRDDLIMPLFIAHGTNIKRAIASMPGIYQHSLDTLGEELDTLAERGITRVILFGIPAAKDAVGSDAFDDEHGIIQRAIRSIRKSHPNFFIISDVCFCEYTSHGHCGVLDANGTLNNDATLHNLQHQALSHARAGADMLAPSGMIDGMVLAMRQALDDNGFLHMPIMSYAVKYASAFYGPFRDAVDSSPQSGDRRAYQMDPANAREAMIEAALDVEEGADILMVKPALAYLDIIHRVKERFELPLACYNVSGEYAMIKAAAANGWVDEHALALESLTSMKRAGADIIITYFARDIAPRL